MKNIQSKMTFGVRPSCVAMRRCGSSRALPETQCLHKERNTTCASSCLSSSVVGPGGGFRALASGASSLSCMTGSVEDDASCLFSSITGFSSNLFNSPNVLFSPQRHHALHVPRISSWQIHPERSMLAFQLDASNRFQWCFISTRCSLW